MPTIWEEIIAEDERMLQILNERKQTEQLKKANVSLQSNYFEIEIYPELVSALRMTILLAAEKCALKHQKCVFNAVDCLSEILYHRNTKYPERLENWQPIYFVFYNPAIMNRPFYPLSWILTRKQAATIIQRALRGYNIRKNPDVQEMKTFWTTIAAEGWILQTTIPVARCKDGDEREVRWF